VETQTEEFETKEWFYEEFGWKNGNSTSFDKVDEQNNEDSTLEQSTELLVHKENTRIILMIFNKLELIRLRLLTDDFVYKLDPLKINFTQTTISSWFRGYDGYNIEETTKDLVS
ncbi:35096_t:CDS:2, partial [Gigaspora margarita]